MTVTVLATAAATAPIQQSAILPLMGRLQTSLHASMTSVAWAFTISLLVGAVATPLLSRMGDMYGRRRMLLISMSTMVAGSVLGALSTSLASLIAARVLQGMSAAAVPLAIGIVRGILPREKLPTGLGVVSATMGIGVGGGLVLAGVIANVTSGYRVVFWTIAGIGAAVTALAAFVVRDEGPATGGRLDLRGALLLSGVLVSLLLAISQGSSWGWSSGRVTGLFGAAVVFTIAWVYVERRAAEPLVDVSMIADRGILSASISSLLLGFALYGGFTLIPNFVQAPAEVGYGFDASVLQAGLFLLPTTVLMIVASTQAGRLMQRWAATTLVAVGSGLTALATGWLALFHDHRYDIYLATAVLGIGVGIAFAAMGTLAVENVSPDKTAVASAVNALLRLVGGAVAGALTTAILVGDTLPQSTIPTEHAYQTGLIICTIGAAVAGLASLVFSVPQRKILG
ncbi:MFS transporter [Streptomyces sp. NPDC047123]|uniref:MFS transporter n=1 Tax=Streptomyces sp. NPDC047123 TaxID=3155622 RepID=UPI0033FB6393